MGGLFLITNIDDSLCFKKFEGEPLTFFLRKFKSPKCNESIPFSRGGCSRQPMWKNQIMLLTRGAVPRGDGEAVGLFRLNSTKQIQKYWFFNYYLPSVFFPNSSVYILNIFIKILIFFWKINLLRFLKSQVVCCLFIKITVQWENLNSLGGVYFLSKWQ